MLNSRRRNYLRAGVAGWPTACYVVPGYSCLSETLLDVILDPGGLSVLFQPIFEFDHGERKLHAYECLVRGPRGTNMESANILFDYVRRKREEPRVDRACIELALREAGHLAGTPRINLNVHASTLGRDPEFLVFLGDTADVNGIPPERLTVEIVEHAPPWDSPTFLGVLGALRSIGARVALDDVGLGQSNFRMILECRPDYFKVDRYFANGVHADYHRQAVFESVAQLARRFGGRVVAEGVETPADLETLLQLDVGLVQGHLFSQARTRDSLEAHPLRGVLQVAGLPRVSGP